MASPKKLIIPGRYDRIRDACDFVVSGAEQAGFGPDEIFRIQLACDEACTNIIEHAYGAEDVGPITVTWKNENDAFVVEIRDNGRAFHPEEIPSPSVPDSANNVDELQVGGLGLHFMRTLMDQVEFSFDENGNQLLMIKYITSQE